MCCLKQLESERTGLVNSIGQIYQIQGFQFSFLPSHLLVHLHCSVLDPLVVQVMDRLDCKPTNKQYSNLWKTQLNSRNAYLLNTIIIFVGDIIKRNAFRNVWQRSNWRMLVV